MDLADPRCNDKSGIVRIAVIRRNYQAARFRDILAADILRFENYFRKRVEDGDKDIIEFSVSGVIIVKLLTFDFCFHQSFSLIVFIIFSIDSSSVSSVVSTMTESVAALSGAIARLESL